MSGSRAILVAAWLLLPMVRPLHAESPVERTVVFTDGSILRLTLPDSSLACRSAGPDGTIVSQSLRLSEIKELKLALNPALEEQARVGALIQALGDDSFQKREKAQADLIASAKGFHSHLKEVQQQTADPEIRARLKQILAKLSPDDMGPDKDWDQVVKASDNATVPCDVGTWSARGSFRGKEIALDRANVRKIGSGEGKGAAGPAAPVPPRVERIPRDEERLFPGNLTRIDFEKSPDGKPLTAGEDIGRTFIPKGVTIATSIAGAIVSVNNYDVGAQSHGLSCATHQPLWEGTLTIRFCVPGNSRTPAGVTHVGFWIAAVTPNGTKLEAYDAQEHRLAEIKTIQNGHDFLAVRSSIPIASVKIVPNPQIDSNYTIDDLVFDTPRPFSEWGDPDQFTLVLRGGERLKCRRPAVEADQLNLEGVSVGIEKLSLPFNEVASVLYPTAALKPSAAGAAFWVMLADGTILHGRNKEGAITSRFPALKITTQNLAALWGGETAFRAPAANPGSDEGPLLLLDKEAAQPIREWAFGKKWIETPGWKPPRPFTYETSPLFWVKNPSALKKNTGIVTLASGEQIVLGGAGGITCKSWSAEGVTLTCGGESVDIPSSEVLSISFPEK